MKKLNSLPLLAFSLMFVVGFGCNSLDTGSSPEDSVSAFIEELAKESTTSFEASSLEAAGVDVEGKDAVFSLGWSKFFNPREEEIQERSDAFAVAPDISLQGNEFRHRFGGKDMGDVSLSYGSESVDLFKVELRNGGIFYNFGKRRPGNPRGMLHEDNGEVSEQIPFLAGETYRFDATGSDVFPAVSVEVTAPTDVLQITSPVADTDIDAAGLDIAWQGGDAGQSLMVGLVPLVDRGSFEERHRDRGGRHRGRGFGDRFSDSNGQDGPGRNPHMHFRYVIDENTGSFSVPLEALAKLLDFEGLKGVLIQVRQLLTTEIQDGDATYAVQLRSGDAVSLNVGE